MTEGPLVLFVEDELSIRRFVRATITGQGFRFLEATTGQEGLMLIASHKPDVVLLDLGLPDMDGLDLTRKLREWTQVPIIVVSARGKEEEKVKALDAGADDYLTKPFGVGELMARMRVALRHSRQAAQPSGEPVFETGRLRVDMEKRRVFVGDEEVHLTPIEYRLLTVLIQHAGKVVTHSQLLREVWDKSSNEHSNYLRIYVHQLRQKLEKDPVRPEYIITEAGVGYRLHTDE